MSLSRATSRSELRQRHLFELARESRHRDELRLRQLLHLIDQDAEREYFSQDVHRECLALVDEIAEQGIEEKGLRRLHDPTSATASPTGAGLPVKFFGGTVNALHEQVRQVRYHLVHAIHLLTAYACSYSRNAVSLRA